MAFRENLRVKFGYIIVMRSYWHENTTPGVVLLMYSMKLAVRHVTAASASYSYKFRRQSSERTILGSTGPTVTILGVLK